MFASMLCSKDQFLHDDLPLNEDDREALHRHVEAFKVSVETHIETIALRSRKGKSWDSEVKERYVTYVDWLPESPSLERWRLKCRVALGASKAGAWVC
ncbi:MAG: hypothetical protein V7695_20085, partial [Sulfitobacter sp.]